MSSRTLTLLLAAVFVGAITFLVGRQFHHTLFFVPLFLFWSWGGRRRREEGADDEPVLEPVLSHTDDRPFWQVEQEGYGHRHPDRTHQPPPP